MAQPPVPFSAPRPPQRGSTRHMAPAGSKYKPGISTAVSAAAFAFHFRPRPTETDVYYGTDQSEPKTRVLPQDYPPTPDAERSKWSPRRGLRSLAETSCSAPRGFLREARLNHWDCVGGGGLRRGRWTARELGGKNHGKTAEEWNEPLQREEDAAIVNPIYWGKREGVRIMTGLKFCD